MSCKDFSLSAHNISLDGSILSADMGMVEGGNRERQAIDLNDRIGNNNGELVVSLSFAVVDVEHELTYAISTSLSAE